MFSLPRLRSFTGAKLVALALFALSGPTLTQASSPNEISEAKKMRMGDSFLLMRAHTMRGCLDDGSCRLSLEDYDTASPYLAFLVEDSVFGKFKDADQDLYRKAVSHTFLRLHERPASALYGKKYGGAGLERDDARIPAMAENVKTGLRRVKFFVVHQKLEGEHIRLEDIPESKRTFHENMSYVWKPDNQ